MTVATLRLWLDAAALLAALLATAVLAVQGWRRRPDLWPAALALAILVPQTGYRLVVAATAPAPGDPGAGPAVPIIDRGLGTLFLILLVYGLVRPLWPDYRQPLRWLLVSHLAFLAGLVAAVAVDYPPDWAAGARFSLHWGARAFELYQTGLLLIAIGAMTTVARASRAAYARLAVLALALWLGGHLAHLAGLAIGSDTPAAWGLALRVADLAALALLVAAMLLPDPARRSLPGRYLADAEAMVSRLQVEVERLSAAKAVLEERQRLARELHDSVSQALFSIELNAGAAEALLAKDPARARERLSRLRGAAHEALGDLRALLADLHPPALQGQSLAEALAGYAAALEAREGLTIAVTSRVSGALDPESESELFRIGYEALTNVARHAQASRAWVELEVAPPSFRLRVADDGVGLPPAAQPDSDGARPTFGLSGMRERAAVLGARLTIGPRPGGGTEVVVER